MKSFEEIQKTLEVLDDYPKLYLLGSTGAGKTSIVRSILDTQNDAFPSTSPTRTTVAPTEYVIDSNKDFKSTFIFKSEDDISTSIYEIIELTIDKAILIKNNDNLIEELAEQLEETPDQKFRLKLLLSSEILKKHAKYIIDFVLTKIDGLDDIEEILQLQHIQVEIEFIKKNIINDIKFVVEETCIDYTLFSNELYYIANKQNKKDFIQQNKKILGHKFPSISPLIEYARVEGNFYTEILPDKKSKFILIDGEGIGHDRGEIRNSLSTRHLDFFKEADFILLVEKSNDPLNLAGLSAIETIYFKGYSKKLKLIFSKTDILESETYKKDLNKDIASAKKVLKNSNIDFKLDNNQKFYFSKLDNKGNDETTNEFKRLFRSIKQLSNENKNIESSKLEYDYETLFLNLNTLAFKKQWIEKLNEQHWTIVKAFSKRMSNKENGYNHLKPVFDFWMLIMKEINNFFAEQSISTQKENKIKDEFSDNLMDYIKEEFIEFYNNDWEESYNYYGRGSHNRRKLIIEKIFNSFIVSQNDDDKFTRFKDKFKDDLIKLGANEKSATTRISINKIKINKIYGSRNIQWKLDEYTNILIGKNGSGKSTVLKLLDAKLHNKTNILEKFGNPSIEISIIKEYENGNRSDAIPLGKNAHQQNIDIILVDTFDIIPNTIQDCKDNCEKKLSFLDIELEKQMILFEKYLNKLTKVFDDKNNDIKNEMKRILEDITKGKVEEASKIQDLTIEEDKIKLEVYNRRNNFKTIIDSMFKDTNKNINFELIEKSFSITSKRKDSNIELDLLDLSSGEKQILIVFLTILLKENKPYILMMDEPENSLHSQWQIKFIENIRKLNDNVQLIIATHNPLLMLDREAEEIGKISIEDEIINTNGTGTKYLDICATLLNYPQINSLVGKDLEEQIERVFELKTKDNLTQEDKLELKVLEDKLDGTVASGLIYNRNYLDFLKFVKKENIDTKSIKKMEPQKFNKLLDKYKAKS